MSKVTILSRPNRIVIASKGVQGAPGDITPAALAARDAAQEAATQAAESQSTATAAAATANERATAALAARDAAVGAASAAAGSAATAGTAATAAAGKATEAAASAALAEQARALGANVGFLTRAAMDASLAFDAGKLAYVGQDPTPANNTIYIKTGASGSGGWVQSADRVSGLEQEIGGLEASLGRRQIIGVQGSPANGGNASPNTRILTTPIAFTGTLRTVRVFCNTVSPVTLLIRRFNKSGVPGIVSIGDVFTRVGADIPATYQGTGAMREVALSVQVEAGEYLGFYNAAGNEYTTIAGAAVSPYVTPSAAGNHTTLTAALITSTQQVQVQLFIEAAYVNADLLLAVEQEIASLQGESNVVVSSVDQLPAASAGRIGAVTGGSRIGPVWADGTVWRWVQDNTPVAAWMRLLDLASRDGWTAVYDASNAASLSVESGRVVSLADSLGNFPLASQGTASSRPLVDEDAFGQLAGCVYDGNDSLLVSGPVTSQPTFVLSLLRFDGTTPLATPMFASDGRVGAQRNSVLANTSPATFSAWAEAPYLNGPSLQSSPVVIGVQFNGANSEIWANAKRHSSGSVGAASYAIGRIGSDSAGGRGWVGAIGPHLIFQGTPSHSVVKRMMEAIMDLAGIPTQPLASLSEAAATIRLSDGAVLFGKNEAEALRPSSTVKLMTALLLEKHAPNLDATVTIDASDVVSAGVSNYVKAGDIVTLRALLHALLMISDNNAAEAISRTIGTILEPGANPTDARWRFRTEMNTEAAALGMADSIYYSSWGDGRVSARDHAKVMKELLDSYPAALAAAGTINYTMVVAGADARSYGITNTINPSGAVPFPEFVAGKTGTGDNLGSVVMLWQHGGEHYVTSVLRVDPQGSRYSEARQLIDDVVL